MTYPAVDRPRLPAILQWTAGGRVLVFCLAASSIWCLLAEMYKLVDMRTFFYFILLPSTVLLYSLAVFDRTQGNRHMWRAVIIGTLAGLAGAIAYDVFRLPFVFSGAWRLDRIGIPQMPLFKVFPRFGALILGAPVEQPNYSLAANLIGWTYHFSNGATFGVMFAAMYVGSQEVAKAPAQSLTSGRAWQPIAWATLMAVGVELCLLASPYASFFDIQTTVRFIVVTMIAHVIFGVAMGAYFAWHAAKWRLPASATAT
jgi:hypothetical protein